MSLTAKQEAFARAIVAGKGPSDAYRGSYDSKSNAAGIARRAQTVLNHPEVQARIHDLREKADKTVARELGLTRARKRWIIEKFVEKAVISDSVADLTPEQLRAMEIDNKMAGHNEPDQVEHSGMGGIMDLIRKAARKP